MITDDQWMSAGKEPRLSDMLSDPAMRNLMEADGVNADEVNAIIDRIRSSVRPMQFVPRRSERLATAKTSKFVRTSSTRYSDHAASMMAASSVVSRWIASLVADKRFSLD